MLVMIYRQWLLYVSPQSSLKRMEVIIVDKWEFYKDPQGMWRWRRTAPNGNIVGASTEGYANKEDCVANARRNGYSG